MAPFAGSKSTAGSNPARDLRQPPTHRHLYQDLSSAHSSITSRAHSVPPSIDLVNDEADSSSETARRSLAARAKAHTPPLSNFPMLPPAAVTRDSHCSADEDDDDGQGSRAIAIPPRPPSPAVDRKASRGESWIARFSGAFNRNKRVSNSVRPLSSTPNRSRSKVNSCASSTTPDLVASAQHQKRDVVSRSARVGAAARRSDVGEPMGPNRPSPFGERDIVRPAQSTGPDVGSGASTEVAHMSTAQMADTMLRAGFRRAAAAAGEHRQNHGTQASTQRHHHHHHNPREVASYHDVVAYDGRTSHPVVPNVVRPSSDVLGYSRRCPRTPAPRTPLPPLPANASGPTSGLYREDSNFSENWSSGSYDTREMLGIAQANLSAALGEDGRRMRSTSMSIDSGKASSAVLAEGNDGPGVDTASKSDRGSFRSGSDIDEVRSDHHPDISPILRPESTETLHTTYRLVDPPARVAERRHISDDLQRISQLSGASRLSGSIVVVTPQQVAFGTSSDSSSKGRSSGQNSHDSSKHEVGQRMSQMHSSGVDIVPTTEVPRQWTRANRDSDRATSSQNLGSNVRFSRRAVSEYEDFGEGVGQDEEGDWETVADGTGTSRYDVRFERSDEPAGSSLADNSSYASLSPEHPKFLSTVNSREVLRHPADERYDHVYRVHRTAPGGEPMLLPAYHFEGGMGFPNRNALTPPSPVSSTSGRAYQHPSPLSKDHVHPFQSSPPVIMDSGRKLPLAYRALRASEKSSSEEYELGQMRPGRQPRQQRQQQPSLGSYGVSSPYDHGGALGQFDFGEGSSRRGPPDLIQTSSSGRGSRESDLASSLNMGEAIGGDDFGNCSRSTLLGLKRNVPGTGQGSGMRELGSRLVQSSSPAMEHGSNTIRYAGRSPAVTAAAVRRSPPLPTTGDGPGLSLSGENSSEAKIRFNNSLQAHREVLAAEGLLPEIAAPHGDAAGSEGSSPVMGPSQAASSVMTLSPSPTTYLEAFARPASYDPTPSTPPTAPAAPALTQPTLPRLISRDFSGFDYHLRRIRRDNSSTATVTWRRKQQLSRAVLAGCVLFPPLLLLYGYGMLDGMMAAMTHGRIEHFGRQQKRTAIFAGWSFAFAVLAGVIVAVIIIVLQ